MALFFYFAAVAVLIERRETTKTRMTETDVATAGDIGRCPACGCLGPNPGYVALNSEEVTASLQSLTSGFWRLGDDGKYLRRSFKAKNFAAAIDFINSAARVAEREDIAHHPDIHLTKYRDVEIRLQTHSAGGLTAYDFKLALELEKIKVEYSPKWLKSHPNGNTSDDDL